MTALSKLVKVKGLVWERGIVDYAKPMPGMKYVACSTTPAGSWAWWLDGAPETRSVRSSEGAAKSAAQADYTARVKAALEPTELVAELVETLNCSLQFVERLEARSGAATETGNMLRATFENLEASE